MKHPDTHGAMLDMLALMRDQWLTRRELSERTRLCIGTVRRWTDLLVAKGMVTHRKRAGVFQSPSPREYTVATAWKGSEP